MIRPTSAAVKWPVGLVNVAVAATAPAPSVPVRVALPRLRKMRFAPPSTATIRSRLPSVFTSASAISFVASVAVPAIAADAANETVPPCDVLRYTRLDWPVLPATTSR